MGRLKLNIHNDVYKILIKIADMEGKTVEAVAVEILNRYAGTDK